MAGDKKDYEAVLGVLVEHGTLSSFINKLNKVSIATEDDELRKAITPVVWNLEKSLQSFPNNKKSAKLTLTPSSDLPPFKTLARYCLECIQSKKPQWQIIAERHGWGRGLRESASETAVQKIANSEMGASFRGLWSIRARKKVEN